MKKIFHKFSLSGLPGILFGIISILFIYLIDHSIKVYTTGNSPLSYLPINFFEYLVIFGCFLFVVLSFLIIIYSNKFLKITWDTNSKKIRKTIILFLIFGILISSLLYKNGEANHIISSILLLFGVLLMVLTRYSERNTISYSLFFLLLGILSVLFNQLQYVLFGIGFGIIPIIYGIKNWKFR